VVISSTFDRLNIDSVFLFDFKVLKFKSSSSSSSRSTCTTCLSYFFIIAYFLIIGFEISCIKAFWWGLETGIIFADLDLIISWF